MPRVPRTVQPWQPTPEQEYAARLLATPGMTWMETAREVGIAWQTIGRWLRRSEFRDLRDMYVAQVMDRLSHHLESGAVEMFELWHKMVTGQVLPDDKRLDRIQPIVQRYYERAFTFDAPDDPSSRQPGVAVQIVNHSGGRAAGS